MTIKKLLLISALCFSLIGCERYTWTFNERPVYNPPALYNQDQIKDLSLFECVDQVVQDQRIIQAAQLTQLNCSYAGVRSVEGLPVLTGLRSLDLSGNDLSDIKPLLYLPYLDTVNLENNPQLDCNDAGLLAEQLTGKLHLPKHCQ